jgi:hypothetical protein
MALLRISNIAHPRLQPLTRRGNATIHSNFLQINLRWTKSLQKNRQSAHIKLFPIPNSTLCLIQAFHALQSGYPVRPTGPFLSYRSSGRLLVRGHRTPYGVTLTWMPGTLWSTSSSPGYSLVCSCWVWVVFHSLVLTTSFIHFINVF